MTVHLDTSALVDAICGSRRSLRVLDEITARGDRPLISTIVLYEWLRGPRTRAELLAQEELFSRADAVPFGPLEADMAAKIYTRVSRPRSREFDIAVAACALVHGGALWTLNRDDFQDIPDLRLV
jgi:predicted nucleic acid-binding protein